MNKDPVILEVAINGGVTPDRNPHVPLTDEAVIADSLACYDAGASIIHAHTYDIRLNGKAGAETYLRPWRVILAKRPGTLWYPTLSVNQADGANLEPIADRYSHYPYIAAEVPMQFGVVDPGSTNLGYPGPSCRWCPGHSRTRAHVSRRGGGSPGVHRLRCAGRRLRGRTGPAPSQVCGRDAGAAGARQLLSLGIFQQRAGEEGALLRLCVRGHRAGDAAGRTGVEGELRAVESRPSGVAGGPVGCAGLHLFIRPASPAQASSRRRKPARPVSNT
jgi:hypothetical protein